MLAIPKFSYLVLANARISTQCGVYPIFRMYTSPVYVYVWYIRRSWDPFLLTRVSVSTRSKQILLLSSPPPNELIYVQNTTRRFFFLPR